MANIIVGIFIDGYTEGMDAHGLCLDQGMPGVFDGIIAHVVVIVLRLTVRNQTRVAAVWYDSLQISETKYSRSTIF